MDLRTLLQYLVPHCEHATHSVSDLAQTAHEVFFLGAAAESSAARSVASEQGTTCKPPKNKIRMNSTCSRMNE